jgi:argininosuccinate synthase
MPEKVVLAYSGGLDTSIIIPWLKENYSCEVIAMVADVGQGDDIDAVLEKAYKTGATKVVVEDLREEFLTEYVFPSLKAGAVYEHKYLLGTSMARPVIAKHQVEVALREGATAVAHGCTGKGNDQVRFELTYQALAPQLKVIAPWREWTLKSREDCLDYAEAHGVPLAQSREKIHSRDRNLWHISHEGGELEDAGNAPFDTTWQISKSPKEAPDREDKVAIEFEKGAPVGVNGMRLDPVQLVELLNEIGGRNGVGRADIVENRFVGIKSRGCYETPGGTLLIAAHRELEALCCERDVMHFKQHIALKYAELVYNGLWFTPLREALDAFVESTQRDVTGTVTLSLYKGNVSVLSRQSEHSLYRTDLSSFTMSESYDQKDAAGFIRILGLPSRSQAQIRAQKNLRGNAQGPLDSESKTEKPAEVGR